ncbi:serine hydrolase domain-containing protein [Streptomyces sp. NPDC015032]|uniref:serine hydrolase domain-containing protein n=1 Tax=Streptomyces sp. NPDC015032 TaxID=3364937 RepID=UPI0037019B9D
MTRSSKDLRSSPPRAGSHFRRYLRKGRTRWLVSGAAGIAAAALIVSLAVANPPQAARAGDDHPAPASRQQDLSRKLDQALKRASADVGDPGIQAVLMKNGRLVWSSSQGMANRKSQTPVTDKTLFNYASFGKQMIAAFALHQVEAGVLDLDTPISKYLGDEVAGSHTVTLRMLLTHTSGYPDAYADPAVAPFMPFTSKGVGKRYDPDKPWTFAKINAGIHDPVKPGARQEYSNTGYLVLGRVLSKTAGGDKALERAIQRFLLRAGEVKPMTEDQVTFQRSERALRHFAHGYYTLEDNGPLSDIFTAYGAKGIPTDLYGLPFTDGLFSGTALGAAQFLDALFVRHKLLSPRTVDAMITPTPQSAASLGSYGMGTQRDVVGDRTWQGHHGSYPGFSSQGATDLERGVTLVVVANKFTVKQSPADVIWKQLAKTYATAS